MALPIVRFPIDDDVTIKQGDTIGKTECSFAVDDVIDLTNSTIKMQLRLGDIQYYTAQSGSGITHTGTKAFEIDQIIQVNPFPEGVLKGELQITDENNVTITYFDIELTITKQYTV